MHSKLPALEFRFLLFNAVMDVSRCLGGLGHCTEDDRNRIVEICCTNRIRTVENEDLSERPPRTVPAPRRMRDAEGRLDMLMKNGI